MPDIRSATDYQAIYQKVLEDRDEKVWVKKHRQDNFTDFERTGFPDRKDEAWKNTNLTTLLNTDFGVRLQKNRTHKAARLTKKLSEDDINLVFINGIFDSALSTDTASIYGLKVRLLSELYKSNEDDLKKAFHGFQKLDSFTSLNEALAKNGTVLEIADGVRLNKVIHLVFHYDDHSVKTAEFIKNIIITGSNSNSAIIETYSTDAESSCLIQGVTDIQMEKGSDLEHVQCGIENLDTSHITTVRANLKSDTTLHTFSLGVGGELSRNNVVIDLQEPGAQVDCNGIYIKKQKQHVSNYSMIRHSAPDTISSQLYKGTLDDYSHSVFNGTIIVEKGASGSKSAQLNKNLLLNPSAEADTRPQLEIYNNDVKCNHGATIGQLNQEEIFYFLSRGISQELAVNMLSRGFINEVIFMLKNTRLRNIIQIQLDSLVFERIRGLA